MVLWKNSLKSIAIMGFHEKLCNFTQLKWS